MLREMKVFTIDAMSSNSMKSSNPHSGIHETEVAKCLDTMCLDPGCNQGGHMVVIALEGNGARPSHMGKGFSKDGRMYTLNTIEQHSVCFRKSSKPKGKDGLVERWVADEVTNTLNCFEFSNDTRTPEIIMCYDGQSCRSDPYITSPVQASRADDHHIPAVCIRKGNNI